MAVAPSDLSLAQQQVVQHSKISPHRSEIGQKHRIDAPDEFAACPLCI
jgi:hypothetical protein